MAIGDWTVEFRPNQSKSLMRLRMGRLFQRMRSRVSVRPLYGSPVPRYKIWSK